MDRRFCADVYRLLLVCVRSTNSKRAILPDKHREQVPWLRQGFIVSPPSGMCAGILVTNMSVVVVVCGGRVEFVK